MKKTIYILIGIFCLGLVVVFVSRSIHENSVSKSVAAAHGEAAGLPTVAVARVQREDLSRFLTLSAEFRPYQEVNVHAKVSGYVQKIGVDVGDHVKAGDTLAVLEIPELKDDLKKASASTRVAKEAVKRAQAKYDDIHSSSQRLMQVAKEQPNLVAAQDVDSARNQDQAAAAALSEAQQQVEECQANENKMLTMISYAVITAPFDGVITHRYADTGALVQAGTTSNTQAMPVVSIAQDNLLRLVFPVPESAVSYVQNGTPVEVMVSSLNKSFNGKVVRFSCKVDRTTRTMETEVDIPNPDLHFTPGMYASVKITIEERKNVLNIPVQSLSSGDQPTVMVINKEGTVEEKIIKTGMETPEAIEVLSGLEEDDLVVVGARGQLRTGEHVTPRIMELAQTKVKSGGAHG